MQPEPAPETPTDARDLRIFWALVAAATVALVVAGVGGLGFAIADPRDGTTSNEVLRAVTAVGGLATGVLAGAAAIWAQVRNLWRFAPRWFRYLAWGVLLVVVVVAAISSAAAD